MPKATPRMPALPRGCGWSLLVAGALSTIIGILSIAAIPRVWKRSKEVWLEAPGTVAEATVERGERKGSRSKSLTGGRSRSIAVTYTVMLSYDYTVNNSILHGAAPCLEQPGDDESYAQVAPILERYPAGRKIAVFYHPEKAERSRLTAMEPTKEIVLDLVFTFLFTLFGAAFLVWGRGILKRRRRLG